MWLNQINNVKLTSHKNNTILIINKISLRIKQSNNNSMIYRIKISYNILNKMLNLQPNNIRQEEIQILINNML